MSADDVVHHEDLAEGVTAEISERSTLSGSMFLSRGRIVWTMRPRFPLRPVFNQGLAAVCFWIAGWAPFAPSWIPEGAARGFIAAFGAMLSYVGLVEFFNRTTVTLAGGLLSIRQGPFPWPGTANVPVGEVTAVRTVVVGSEEPAYAVRVVTGLRERSAFTGLRSAEAADRVATFLDTLIDRVRREQPPPNSGLQLTSPSLRSGSRS